MRVTNKMLSNNFLRDMRTNLTNLQALQEQMTSGKEIRRPSDDPFKVARSMQLHTEINTNKQYNSNIKDTINWLDTTDTALGQSGDILHRIRELIVSTGNGTYSDGERKAIKDEINEKISEFAQVMNTSFDGKYIFGGTRGTTKPMDTTGGSSFAGAAETDVLNFSGTDSLVDKDGKLKKAINIKFSVGGSDQQITLDSTDGAIKNLSDIASKLNTKIKANSDLNGKIEVSVDIANNKLQITNLSKDKITIKDEVKDLGIVANKDIDAGKAINSSALNLSGIDSFVSDGKLKKDLTIKVGTNTITIKQGTAINSLGDFANNINTTIESDSNLKGKVRVVADLANSTLKFVNLDSENKNLTVESFIFDNNGVNTTKTSVYNENNNENTRLFYYKKGGGELLGGAEYDQINKKLKVEVSQGVVFDYNVNAKEVIEFKNSTGEEKDLREIFNNIVNHLDGKDADGEAVDPAAIKELLNGDLKDITDTMDNLLKLRSEVGAKQNGMESANNKNVEQNFNMTEILSKTEDIDITEKTMEFAMAQTVYVASLQTSARILQPTLIDYIR